MNGQVGKRVSIKRVVSNVIRNLDITDASRNFYHFVEWAFDAERKIGSYKTFVKKTATINVVNKQASMPNDFLSLIDVKKDKIQKILQINKYKTPDNIIYFIGGFFIMV